MRSILFWGVAALIAFAVTRKPSMLAIAAFGPAVDQTASMITREREATYGSWQLTFVGVVAAGLLVWGIVAVDAALIALGAIALTDAGIWLWHRRGQAQVP